MTVTLQSGLLITRKVDGEKHGNHVRPPQIGIRDLRLKASGKRSKFHLPENAPDPETPETGSDAFNFLPEHDVCDLVFDIDNPFDIVDRARIEITTRFDAKPLWTIDLMKLGPTWTRHGVHTVKWPGQVFDDSAEIAGTIQGEATDHDLAAVAAKPDANDDAPFPDGWLTLQHAPYRLRLVLESDLLPDHPAAAWTYFHVMLEKIEIKLGPEEAIPSGGVKPTLEMEKAVRTQFTTADEGYAGALPKDGESAKIFLVSNNFKTSDAEFAAGSRADFTTYEALWGDGPRIPLIAKLWLRAADGSEIDIETAAKGAKALGRARFMWDWKDPDERDTAPAAECVTYIANSRKRYKNATDTTRPDKDHTYPEGDNCHVDLGGGRGPDAAVIFPDQVGYKPKAVLDAGKFPFDVGTKLVDPKKRKWAAFSTGWTDGKLKGHTGVLFRPTRMAGDNFVVSVTFAWDRDKDGKYVTDVVDKDIKVPAKLTAKTGTFEVWRRIHFSRYIRKTAAVPRFTDVAGVAAYYAKAFIDFRNDMAAGDDYTADQHHNTPGGALTNYNTIAKGILDTAGLDLYDQQVLALPDEDHASVKAVFKVAPYATFVRRVHSVLQGHPDADFDDEGALLALTGDQLAATLGTKTFSVMPAGPTAVATNDRRQRLGQTKNYLVSEAFDTLGKFSKTVERKLMDLNIDLSVAIQFPSIDGCGPSGAKAKPGIVVFHWEYLHSGTQEFIDAGNPDHGGGKGAAVDAVGKTRDTAVFALQRLFVATFAHEVGHHMFLPHTNPPAGDAASLRVHDGSDPRCLMSYKADRHDFCGLCLLRLRGWDGAKLDRDSTKNTKP